MKVTNGKIKMGQEKTDEEMKTSEEWLKGKYLHEVQVLDPDGWDRKNFGFSWFEEKITEIEFNNRLGDSTCLRK